MSHRLSDVPAKVWLVALTLAVLGLFAFVVSFVGEMSGNRAADEARDQQLNELGGVVLTLEERLEQANQRLENNDLPRVDDEVPLPPELDDLDPDDPETQDGETQDAEVNDPDPDDPESQNPEPDDGEVNDPEPDDPEQQDQESQDAENQDGDPNDPDPVDDPDPDDPDPDDPETQDPEVNDPDPPIQFIADDSCTASPGEFVTSVDFIVLAFPGVVTYVLTCETGLLPISDDP